uniref:Transmembrane protein n=1 Tax=Ascaris lumbricoides TaxID=6252 RepID=A0A0M3IPW7_ASCLU
MQRVRDVRVKAREAAKRQHFVTLSITALTLMGGMTNRFSGSMLMDVLMCLSRKWQHLMHVRTRFTRQAWNV